MASEVVRRRKRMIIFLLREWARPSGTLVPILPSSISYLTKCDVCFIPIKILLMKKEEKMTTHSAGFKMPIEKAKAHQREQKEELLELLNTDKNNEEDFENVRGELERMTKVFDRAVGEDGLKVGWKATQLTWTAVVEKESEDEGLKELKKLLCERLEARRVSKHVS